MFEVECLPSNICMNAQKKEKRGGGGKSNNRIQSNNT